MKAIPFKKLVLLTFVLASITIFTQCEKEEVTDDISLNNELLSTREYSSVCDCLTSGYPMEELTTFEEERLAFMREEEKLARDIYQALYSKWQFKVFNNISKSEQRHMDLLLCLIEKYGLTDPVGSADAGIFINQDLQALYAELLAQGELSEVEALKVGAKIEDLDIYDLMAIIPGIDNQDMIATYTELTRGSRNHLRAFIRNLNNLDESYAPEFISEILFDEIITSPKETGSELCPGLNICEGYGGNGNGGNGNCQGICPNGGNGTANGNCNGTGNGQGGNCTNGNNGNGGNGNGNGGNGSGGNCNGGNGNGGK